MTESTKLKIESQYLSVGDLFKTLHQISPDFNWEEE